MVLVVVGMLVLVSCGQPAGNDAAGPRSTTEAHQPPDDGHDGDGSELGFDRPPPVTVRDDDQSFELDAWTFCYDSGCADGAPPENPPDIGSPDEVYVEFPLDGWRFDASFKPSGEKCPRSFPMPLEEVDDGVFLLKPAGYAGSYDVTLFGEGGGDLFVTFRWTTPSDGPLPEPEARAGILADHDGEVDSYGVELAVDNLPETPRKASARITVEAENGESLSFEAKPSKLRCMPEGNLYWDGPDDQGLAAAELGDGSGSFTYTVDLMLDGERFEASARWPEDEIEGNEPSVALEFSPPLPALE
jgi:hypothetical protein